MRAGPARRAPNFDVVDELRVRHGEELERRTSRVEGHSAGGGPRAGPTFEEWLDSVS
jgi:hypothetical protein